VHADIFFWRVVIEHSRGVDLMTERKSPLVAGYLSGTEKEVKMAGDN
jgi:hypothetical protein